MPDTQQAFVQYLLEESTGLGQGRSGSVPAFACMALHVRTLCDRIQVVSTKTGLLLGPACANPVSSKDSRPPFPQHKPGGKNLVPLWRGHSGTEVFCRDGYEGDPCCGSTTWSEGSWILSRLSCRTSAVQDLCEASSKHTSRLCWVRIWTRSC